MVIIQNEDLLYKSVRELLNTKIVYFDIESTGLDPYTEQLALVSLRGGGKTYVIDVPRIGATEVLRIIKPVLEDPVITKVAHNAVFDWKWLYHVGQAYTSPVVCTLINEQILKAGIIINGYGLDDLAERRLGKIVDKSIRNSFIGRDLSIPFTREELEYSGGDVDLLEPIYEQQLRELVEEHQDAVYEWECKLIPITARLEYAGVCVNKEHLVESWPVVKHIIENASNELQDMVIDKGLSTEVVFSKDGYMGVNAGSPAQMLSVFNAMGIGVKSLGKKELSDWDATWAKQNHGIDTAEVSDDDDIHIGFMHPILRTHAIRTAAAKIEGTYIAGLLDRINPVTHRIHPGFKQCGAVSTGRYSSVAPNFQNIPNKEKLDALGMGAYDIRSMFIPERGRDFIISDYSGIELAILAAMSGDEQLTYQIIQGDIHSFVANNLCGPKIEAVLGELITPKNKKSNKIAKRIRDKFKPVSYGIIYGSTGYNLYRTLYFDLLGLGVPITKDECDVWVERWKHELFPDTGVLLRRNSEYAISRYYTESALGRRRRWTPDIRYDKWRMFAAMREGSNQPIQATCADMLKIAMVRLDAKLDHDKGRIVACIHDELLSETEHDYTSTAVPLIKDIMESSACMLFPNADPRLFIAEPKVSNCYDK